MKKLILLFLSIVCVYHLNAQDAEIPKVSSGIDLGIGLLSNNVVSPSVAWTRTHGLGKKNKIRIGYGVRFHAFVGSDLEYTTAPANLINDNLVDTILVSNVSTMGLSAALHASYYFTPKLVFDFNIDVIGLGFGPSQTATGSTITGTADASPTSFNLLISGPLDIGQLKSNFALSYLVTDNIRLRVGADMHFSEYTTAMVLANDNDRFRYIASGFFIGGTYYLN